MNCKISRRSFPRYQKLSWLLGSAFRSVQGWCVQTEGDAERVAALTGRPWPTPDSPITVTGNVKFDLTLDVPDASALAELRQRMGLASTDRMIVVGSTHPGEEEAILNALSPVVTTHPDTVVVLVPRHPERFAEAWSIVERLGWSALRLSDGFVTTAPPGAPRAVYIDAMGLLVRLYAGCEVAIVAGSFSGKIGGHNVLEPAVFGKPVLFGMDMKGQPELAQVLIDADGCIQCPAENLGQEVARLLDDSQAAIALGGRAKSAVEANHGAAQRSVTHLLRCLGQTPISGVSHP